MSEMIREFFAGLHRRPAASTAKLSTPWMDQPEVPWAEYPRPQLRRDSFFCLNGDWDLSWGGEYRGEIRVPYPVESQLSRIGKSHPKGEILTYQRPFVLPDGFCRDRVLLHFGAVDQICHVFLNDTEVGFHEGGYLPFTLDVTEQLQDGGNRLRVEVQDDLDRELPYGKQRENRGGMWYTPVSGIWQTVWMESVPEHYIENLYITADMESVTVEITGGTDEMYLSCDGKRYALQGKSITFSPENPRLWSPEDPYLYEFTVEAGEDRVESYFAMRELGVRKVGEFQRTFLNRKPCFFHGVLDQGWYPDGLYLPGSPEGYTADLQMVRELGFNTVRKHLKVEPERFYYDCDRLGILVFQDLVNSGHYRYLLDTALPTLGLKSATISAKPSARRRQFFEEEARRTVAHLHNHPCVVLYTIFNEGWGQHDTAKLYRELKELDPSRMWNSASGWFRCRESDIQSEHQYFGRLKFKNRREKPLILTEFGGYSWAVKDHRFNPEQEYGYRKFTSRAELGQALQKLYWDELIPQVALSGLCGAILTQLSDVEDETNGLVTYDRRLRKVDREQMLQISRQLQDEMTYLYN